MTNAPEVITQNESVVRTVIQFILLPIIAYIAWTAKFSIMRLLKWQERVEEKFEKIFAGQEKLAQEIYEVKGFLKGRYDSPTPPATPDLSAQISEMRDFLSEAKKKK
jgi:hypothetical protein